MTNYVTLIGNIASKRGAVLIRYGHSSLRIMLLVC